MFQKSFCDVCHQNAASVWVTKIMYGKTSRQRLCESCAGAQGAGEEWLEAFEQQNDQSQSAKSGNADLDDVVQNLFNHMKNASNGEHYSDDQNSHDGENDTNENDFDFHLPADELDELLSEMESVLDDALGEDETEDDDSDVTPGVLQAGTFLPPAAPRETLSSRCSKCGTTWDRLREDGRVGCAHCYESFEEKLLEVMGRMQRGAHHVGKVPREAQKRRRRLEQLRTRRDHRLEMLQSRLEEAVANENYEDAAALRDKIKIVSSTIVSNE